MSKVYYKGVDVSQFQGTIDWKRVKNAGIEFVIPRTGFGRSTEDKIFKATTQNAPAAGVDIPAVYHFSYACTAADARTEAEFAVSLCQKYKLPKSTVIFYDFEYESANYFTEQQGKKKSASDRVKLTPAIVQLFTTEFCNRVTELGYQAGVYFNQDYYVNWYEKGKSFTTEWKTWLADLEGGPNYPCDIQQTSHTGRVAGISTSVDLDECFYDYKSGSTETHKEDNPKLKSVDEVAKECIQGLWGNGAVRKSKLTKAGYDYATVQARVNELVAKENPKKAVTDEVVMDVVAGKYGNGDDRKQKLEAAGYVYKDVQDAVNKYLSGVNTQTNISKNVSPAQSFDKNLAGKYKVTAEALNLRYIPGLLTTDNVVKILMKNTIVQCWGYYTQKQSSKWMLIQVGSLTGFVDGNYLTKV